MFIYLFDPYSPFLKLLSSSLLVFLFPRYVQNAIVAINYIFIMNHGSGS